MSAAGDPLPGFLKAFTNAKTGRIRRSDALAAIGVTSKRPDPVFCERQIGAQCGQHALNNVLQEAKTIRIEADSTNLIVGPRNECRSVVELLQRRDVKVNMRALCTINAGYCSGAGNTWYSDDALIYILQSILRYSTEYIIATGRTDAARMQFVENLVTSLRQPLTLGCILNQGGGHWTAITKFADSAAACPGRQYVFLNSTQVDAMVCLNEGELRNFLHLKFQESDLRSAITIGHNLNISYVSTASSRLVAARAAIVAPTGPDRFTRAYELYRAYVNNPPELKYMINNPDKYPLNSVIKPALRAKKLNNEQIDLYLNESTMKINQFKNLIKGEIEPAPAPVPAPVPVNITTPEYRRQRLLELYQAYTDDPRKLNNLKKLNVRDLPESEIMNALADENVPGYIIDGYLGSTMNLDQVESIFMPVPPMPGAVIPKPLLTPKTPKAAPVIVKSPNVTPKAVPMAIKSPNAPPKAAPIVIKSPNVTPKTPKTPKAAHIAIKPPNAALTVPISIPTAAAPVTRTSNESRRILNTFRKTYKNTNKEKIELNRRFKEAISSRSANRMSEVINYANRTLKSRPRR